MFIFSYIALGLAFIYLVGAMIILKNKGKSQLARYLAFFIFFTGVWVAANGWTDLAPTELIARLGAGLALVGGTFFIGFFICFTRIFIKEKKLSLKEKIIIFIFPVFFSSFAFSKYYISDIKITGINPAETTPGILNTFVLLYSFIGLIYSTVLILRHYQKAALKKKKQIIYMGIGFFVLLFSAIFFNVFMPILGELRFFSLGTMLSVFMIISTCYAIFKHQLLDIKVVIQKSIVYTLLLVVIISLYLGILFIFLFFTQETNNLIFLINAILTTVIGILTVPKIKKYFNEITDRVFFKDKYDYSLAVHELSEILNKYLELRDILDKTTYKLEELIKVKFVCVYLEEKNIIFAHNKDLEKNCGNYPEIMLLIRELAQKEETISADDAIYTLQKKTLSEDRKKLYEKFKDLHHSKMVNTIVPLKTKQKTIGALVVGDKLSGESLTNDDRQLLKTFAEHATLAIEKSKLFEQVKDYSNNLAKKVEDRTSKIKAIQQNQEQLISDISHKLQTPLTVLKGELHRLEQNNPQETSWPAFEKSIDHVSKFIADMLKIARLDFASHQGKREMFNLSELMLELVEYFAIPAQDQGCQIDQQIQDDVEIYGVKENIEELITNLVSNAVKYNANEKLITIKLEADQKNIYIEISDTGIGIPEDEIAYLFKRFYRPQKSGGKTIEGTGLGLAICEKIVQNHQGKIRISSKLNQGTTVTVIIPKNIKK